MGLCLRCVVSCLLRVVHGLLCVVSRLLFELCCSLGSVVYCIVLFVVCWLLCFFPEVVDDWLCVVVCCWFLAC